MVDLQKVSKDLVAYAWNIPRAIVLGAMLFVVFLFFVGDKKAALQKIGAQFKNRWLVAFFFYLAFILMGTIFARQHTIPYKRVFENFGFRDDDPNWNKEIIENIGIFIPYSILLLQAFEKRRNIRSIVICTLMTSATIEVAQLLFWVGSFQFADIIHNLIGGCIGFLFWILIMKTKEKLGRGQAKR